MNREEIKMTVAQASAMRSILRYEAVGRIVTSVSASTQEDGITGEQLVAGLVNAAENWVQLDRIFAFPIHTAIYMPEGATLANEITCYMNEVEKEVLIKILKTGHYIDSLKLYDSEAPGAAFRNIPIVMISKNIQALKKIFGIIENEPEKPFVFEMVPPPKGYVN